MVDGYLPSYIYTSFNLQFPLSPLCKIADIYYQTGADRIGSDQIRSSFGACLHFSVAKVFLHSIMGINTE